MSPARSRPILVTGTHRSGSTWVGRVIAAHPGVVYISEPFNWDQNFGRSPVRYWFHHVTPPEEKAFDAYLRPTIEFRTSWWQTFRQRPTPRQAAVATWRKLRGAWRRGTGARPLLKDPIALFSAPWLARTYDADVVVLIRHPAAFVNSLKRLGWDFGFHHLLRQPALLAGMLSPFADLIARYTAEPPDLVDQAILLWRIFHHVIRCYQEEHPGWLFVRHEDLSLDPQEGFARLLGQIGLAMTTEVIREVERYSAPDNPAETAGQVVQQLLLDSRQNVWSWKRRLSALEISRIRRGTQDVSRHFYSAADWEGPADELRQSA
jgi:hypothetical protein